MFYHTYHGHQVDKLLEVHNAARTAKLPITWLAGDSSLDNKFWVKYLSPPKDNQLTRLFKGSQIKPDVAYWMNEGNPERMTINTAVEESTLEDRSTTLLPQDQLIQNCIAPEDILIVSVGCNDIVHKPSRMTQLAMATLLLTPSWMIRRGLCIALPYFIRLFKDKTADYIERLVAKQKPQHVLVCMIYYPDENSKRRSWASTTLDRIGYNENPHKLQLIIRHLYQNASRKIRVAGVNVHPVPLYNVMNGMCSSDYSHRVEPSDKGGKKMADHFKHLIDLLRESE